MNKETISISEDGTKTGGRLAGNAQILRASFIALKISSLTPKLGPNKRQDALY